MLPVEECGVYSEVEATASTYRLRHPPRPDGQGHAAQSKARSLGGSVFREAERWGTVTYLCAAMARLEGSMSPR